MFVRISDEERDKVLNVQLGTESTVIKYDSLALGDFVIGFDLSADNGIEGILEFQGGNTPATVLRFLADGNIMTKQGGIHVANYGKKPVTLLIGYHADTHRFDIYADGKMIAKDYCADIITKLNYISVFFDKCINFILDVKAVSDVANITIENVKVYSAGNIPEKEKVVVLTDETWFGDESYERNYMKDKVSVHLRSGVAYANGEKITLKNTPYKKDDEIMVPLEFLDFAYGIAPGDDECLCEENDGVLYFCLNDAATKILKKRVYTDNNAIHSGLVILADDAVLPDGENLQKINDFCFYIRPSKQQWLADYNASELKGIHPRVMATANDFDVIREEIKTNKKKKRWFENLIDFCEQHLNEESLKYELRDGVRLMYVSDDFMKWTISFAMAYKLTGNKKYFDTAWKHIEAVSAFPDWNPVHHIDVGIMALGYGVAYDWFYDVLTSEQRTIMEKGVYQNMYWIVNEAHKSFHTPYGDPGMKDNHNVFCNAGVIACAIAFMDVYPEIGSQLGANTMRLLERFLWLFAPFGAYFEGPSYASISIDYTTRLFAAMEPTMGTLYGMDKAEALDLTGDYIINMQSDAAAFGFGDGDPELKRCAGILWLYKHYNKTWKQDIVANLLDDAVGIDAVAALLNYSADSGNVNSVSSDLGVYYPGEEIVIARDSFNEGQVYAGIKAAGTIHPHSHLDSGSFVFDAQGVRWAHDLGADDYNLEFSWGFYDIFRRRSESHNTLLIDPDGSYGYVLDESAKLLSYEIKPEGVITKSDLTKLYGGKAQKAKRGFFFTDDRHSLVVRDEVILTKLCELYWLMYIDSDVEFINENKVILTDRKDKSKQLCIEFLSSGGRVSIGVEDAVPFPKSPQIPDQDKNEGFSRLYYKIDAESYDVTITAKIIPLNYKETESSINEYHKDMDLWRI